MFRTDRGLPMVAAIAAAVCGLLLLWPGTTWLLTAPAAALLVLVLPGFAIMRALFGRRLEAVEQVALSLAISVAVTIVTGLVLNLLPQGLAMPQWGFMLGGISVVACGVALLRGDWTAGFGPDVVPGADAQAVRDAQAVHAATAAAAAANAADLAGWVAVTPEQAIAGEPAIALERSRPVAASKPLPRAQLAMIGTAIVLLVVALGVARLGVAAQPHDPFTQFWMLPNASGQSVEVGATNEEGKATTYSFFLRIDGKTVQELRNFVVAQDATWSQDLTLPFNDTDSHSVTALLYRANDTLPYREAHSTITQASPAPGTRSTPAPSQVP